MRDPKPEKEIDSEEFSQSDQVDEENRNISIGDVGDDAQIAIGSSITQIGTQVVKVFKANLWPVLLMLALVLTGVGLILFLMLRPEEQRPMDGLFNIAVAAFADRQDGQIVDSPEGERVATLLAEELTRQLPERDFLIWGPKERDMQVSGEGAAERFVQAVELSNEIEADVIIYGLIEQGDSLKIEPEILIDLESFVLGEELLGEELDGAYQLGPAISFPDGDLDHPGNLRELREKLASRASPLSHFALGLDSYRTDDFENALESFSLAEEMAQAWEGSEGKGAIYLFLGAAELNLGIATKEKPHFTTAHNWFDAAKDENAAYARSHLGHGFAFLQEANLLIGEGDVQDFEIVAQLTEAEEAFQKGLGASFKPPNGDVDAKANFGLGRAYFLSSQFSEKEHFDESELAFKFVIDQFNNGNPRLQELAARSYGWLGLQNYQLRNDAEAIEAYQCALELGRYETLRQAWTEKLDELCLENNCPAPTVEGVCNGSQN